MTRKYILDKKGNPVPEDDVLRWGMWFEKSGKQRVVGRTTVGKSKVSTVFLGLDHNYGEGAPILWETMVFGGKLDHLQERCSGSRKEAEAMHRRIVNEVKGQNESKHRL